jgi:hypothetical protein
MGNPVRRYPVMVMVLFNSLCHSDPQYLAVSVRTGKTHTLRVRDQAKLGVCSLPPVNFSLFKGQPFSNSRP